MNKPEWWPESIELKEAEWDGRRWYVAPEINLLGAQGGACKCCQFSDVAKKSCGLVQGPLAPCVGSGLDDSGILLAHTEDGLKQFLVDLATAKLEG